MCFTYSLFLIIKIVLQEFLSLGELQESGNLEKSGLRPKKEDRKVVLQDVTASWDKVRQDLDWILSQDLETGCPKYAIVKDVSRETTIYLYYYHENMYLLIEIRHSILI